MTEIQAFLLDAVVGCVLTWGSVVLLAVIGANDGFQLVAAMLGLAITSFMVGVIGRHYEREEIGRGEDPERR
ncbi:MAG TPA: hypothetical protein VGH14_14715 [Solirubrobacterales bacterium]|jgi:hypothetical protein